MIRFAERGLHSGDVTLQTFMDVEIVAISEDHNHIQIALTDLPQLIRMLEQIQENPELFDVG